MFYVRARILVYRNSIGVSSLQVVAFHNITPSFRHKEFTYNLFNLKLLHRIDITYHGFNLLLFVFYHKNHPLSRKNTKRKEQPQTCLPQSGNTEFFLLRLPTVRQERHEVHESFSVNASLIIALCDAKGMSGISSSEKKPTSTVSEPGFGWQSKNSTS